MQTDDQVPPSTASEKPSGAAGGSMPKPISHDEARQSAQRLINSHFSNGKQYAKTCIPAEDDDDDLLICRYIEQQRARDRGSNG